MNFLLAKLFENYKRTYPLRALFHLTIFIAMLYFLIAFDVFLIVNEILNCNINPAVALPVLLVLALLGSYWRFVKKGRIFKLEERYRARKINQLLLYAFAIGIPLLLFLLGPILLVVAKGGWILNHPVTARTFN